MKFLVSQLAALAILAMAGEASAKSPGFDALTEFRQGGKRPGAIENRFFLKKSRFELAPQVGWVPNNPFSKRYVAGIGFGYHFSEVLGVEGTFSYSPDLGINDLKGLTNSVVVLAHRGEEQSEFQQPLDKLSLSVGFAARWTPFYGKINLFGEAVVNLDIYLVAGLGIAAKSNYVAVYNDAFNDDPSQPPALLQSLGTEVEFTPIIGGGTNIFLTRSVALKLDGRMIMYVDNKPDYDPTTVAPEDSEQQLYPNLIVSAGVAIYFPRMKPRMTNF